MNLRLIGLWTCPLAFVAMLVALAQSNSQLVLIEAALMLTGAVLSLHPKPQRSTTLHINGPISPPSSADIATKLKNHHHLY